MLLVLLLFFWLLLYFLPSMVLLLIACFTLFLGTFLYVIILRLTFFVCRLFVWQWYLPYGRNCKLWLYLATIEKNQQVLSLSAGNNVVWHGDGSRFAKSAYSCHKDNSIPHHYSWPWQPHPGPKLIVIWRKALQICFPPIDGRVQHTLGHCLYPPETTWQCFFHPTSYTIYQRQCNNWQIWRQRNQRQQLGARPKYR